MSKKLTQQELRQLMKENLNKKAVNKRIESPFAKYDEQQRLSCTICNQIIQNQLLWSTHVIGKLHKKKIEELKLKSKSLSNSNEKEPHPTNHNAKTLKRSLPIEIDDKNGDEIKSSKVSKKSSTNNNNVDKPDETLEDLKSSLPKDFFETGTKEKEMDIETNDDIKETSELPKGFFDDPKIEQKFNVKNNINGNQTIDSEYELFRQEIAEESQNILDDEVDELEKQQTIIEIDEQIENWSKIDEIQKKIEEIHRKNTEKQKINNSVDDNEVDDDDDDQIDFNDMNFWRNKDVFR